MVRDVPILLLILLTGVLLVLSVLHPSMLSNDGNYFLRDFMDADILSILGFITAVGNASTLTLHLQLNNLEDCTEARFVKSRISLKKSAIFLVYAFSVVFIALILRPILPDHEIAQALVNSIGIICMFVALSVLRDITICVFTIPTKKAIDKIAEGNRRSVKDN